MVGYGPPRKRFHSHAQYLQAAEKATVDALGLDPKTAKQFAPGRRSRK
jgi:hypothetical protein